MVLRFVLAASLATAGLGSDLLGTDRCYTEPQWRHQEMLNYSGAFERCGSSTVCVQGQGCQDFCTADEECEDFPMRVCAVNSQGAKCQHKDLFGQASGRDVGAAFAFFIISGLALSAGIGGGGLYVPLLMILLGFTAHEATGLSQALLSGGASSTLVYNMRQRHPSGNKPMIDYDLVLVMGPNLLIGALVGSALNLAAPSWLILLLLTSILSHSAWKTYQKAVKTLKRERAGEVQGMPANDGRLSKNVIERVFNKVRRVCGWHGRLQEAECDAGADRTPSTPKAQRAGVTSPAVHDVEAPPLDVNQIKFFPSLSPDQIVLFESSPAAGSFLSSPFASPVAGRLGSSPAVGRVDCSPLRGFEASPERRQCAIDAVLPSSPVKVQPPPTVKVQPQFPCPAITQFAVMWLIVIVCIFVRGGRASPGLVSYCGQTYWALTAFTMAALAVLSLLGSRRAVRSASEASGDEDGFHWTAGAARKVAICSLGAGTLAALCGIGGGMVMGPILLDLGVLPQVQSATTATTLLVLSSSSALVFLVQGAAPMDYAFFLAAATASGAVIGKAVMGFLIKLYRRPSAIIFVLFGIIFTSVIVMAITGTIDVVNDFKNRKGLGFNSICAMGSSI